MEYLKKIICLCLIFVLGLGFSLLFKTQTANTNGLYSSKVDKQLLADAFQKANSVSKIAGVSAIVVNHHLLAADLIAETLAVAAIDQPITVILISPNHFTRGTGQVISSRFDWQTPYGILKADQRTITALVKADLINVDETPFEEEHGIYNIVPFIKKYFPKAKIVPLILKSNLSDDQVDLLAKKIAELSNILVVFSFDFSHYQTKAVADKHDEETINTINSYDFENIKNLDVDSKPGVRLMLEYSKIKSTSFNILHHANSAEYVNNLTETTSYIGGVFINSK